jgi:hypothetical protein
MLKKILIVALIIVVMAGVALFFVYNKEHRTADVADASLDASSLVNAFSENEEEANGQFLDKVIEVTGKVKEVIEQGDSYIVLLGDETSMNSVSCTLDPAADSVAYGLQAGDKIVVRGICTGFLMDVVLVNCKVLDKEGDQIAQ